MYLLRPFVIYPIELVLVLTLFCFCKVYYSQILLYLCPFQQIYAYYKFTIAISINSLCFRNLTNMILILSLSTMKDGSDNAREDQSEEAWQAQHHQNLVS